MRFPCNSAGRLLVALLLGAGSAVAMESPQPAVSASVLPFPDGCGGAYSLSFDGSLREHFTVALPAMRERGIRGTFFVIPGLTPANAAEAMAKEPGERGGIAWEEWPAFTAAQQGIGNGSWSHPYLTKIGRERLHREVVKSRQTIERKLGVEVAVFAYPFEARNAAVDDLVRAHHSVVREGGRALGGVGHDLQAYQDWVTEGAVQGEWRIGIVTGIGSDHTGIDAGAFVAHLDWLATRPDIWVAPIAEVAAWLAMRQTITPVVERPAPDRLLVSAAVAGELPAEATAIGVQLEVPGLAGYSEVTAEQDGEPVRLTVRMRDQQIQVGLRLGAAPVSIHLHR